MKKLKFENVASFKDWALLFLDDIGTYSFDEEDVQINIIGEGDGSYMVINIYAGDSASTEYLFFPKNENEVSKAIIFIFDFLKTVDFSLAKLIQWLKTAEFQETEFGMAIYVGEIVVSRSGFTAVAQK